VSWLILATAYRDAHFAEFVQEYDGDIDSMYLRPTIPL
jgi:hypothetical protein